MWSQQIVKLCFSTTNLAENSIMIDFDNYFTKEFDDKILLKKDILKTILWRLPADWIEQDKE